MATELTRRLENGLRWLVGVALLPHNVGGEATECEAEVKRSWRHGHLRGAIDSTEPVRNEVVGDECLSGTRSPSVVSI